jgi:hypothetical protein
MNPPTPATAGGAPAPSYKTNVNRAKTKRWVEAKSYSYDGDEWGEADVYDEYDGYEPGPAPKPTGLRQQGQSTAPTPGVFQGRQDIQQSPITYTEQTYIAPGGKLSQLHQPQSEQAAPGGPTYHQPFNERSNSLSQGEERRVISAGSSQYGASGGNPVPYQQNQNLYQGPPQARGPGPTQPVYQQPTQNRSRPSLDNQARPPGAGPPANYRGVSYSDRLSRDGSRSQSMTSSTSSLEFHTRRDFSPSAMPQPLQTQPRDLPPRKSSLSQDEAPKGLGGSFPPSTGPKPYSAEASEPANSFNQLDSRENTENSAKPLPFVRPAEIYKRMAEEREKERLSHESSRPSMDAILGPKHAAPTENSPNRVGFRQSSDNNGGLQRTRLGNDSGEDSETGRRLKPSLDPVAERKSEYGMEGISIETSTLEKEVASPSTTITQETVRGAEPISSIGSSPRLPPVPRMSGFGSFLGSMTESLIGKPDDQIETPEKSSSPQNLEQPATQTMQNPSLQHQSSLGFRSAVQQAFEDQVPQTPSSAAGSAVARSNSESTNEISPIISRAPSAVTANVRTQEADNREHNIPMIAEESSPYSTRRPGSGDTIINSKATARKPPPSQEPRPDSSESLPTPVLGGHRRNISTPSPDNSPARTPAVEVNRQLRQPLEAEMAVTTPTSVTHSSSNASNVMPARLNLRHEVPDDAAPLQGAASADVISKMPDSTEAVVIPSGIPVPFSDSENPINIASPSTQERNSLGGRAESPSKGRVRDLADKFESRDVSRRGSESSLRDSLSSLNAGRSDETPVTRPQADRMESFRPHIPGGWESYASTAPISGLPQVAEISRQSPRLSIPPATEFNKPELGEPSTSSINLASNQELEQSGLTSNERLKQPAGNTPPLAAESSIISDPVTALAAAGTALAGALAAAVGMNQTGLESTEESAGLEADVNNPSHNRPRAASLKHTIFHPEASKPFIPLEDDSASSVAPTPVDDINETETSNYFPPVVPLKQKPRDIQTGSSLPDYSRPQFLPSLSTETSPNDYESDRLRKQIVRELSPHAEHFPDERTVSLATSQAENRLSDISLKSGQDHESMDLPQEYDSYWDSPNQIDNATSWTNHQDAVAADAPEVAPVWTEKIVDNELASAKNEVPHQTLPTSSEQKVEEGRPDMLQVRPTQLTHRFSWEPAPEQIDTPTQQASGLTYSGPTATRLGTERETRPVSEEPSAMESAPAAVSQSEKQLPEAPTAQGTDSIPPAIAFLQKQIDTTTHMPSSSPMDSAEEEVPPQPVPDTQATIPAFREILALKTPEERVEAYKATREQFAKMNTGLDQWINEKLDDLPEHAELASNGGVFGNHYGHRPVPAKGKFPGLRAASGQTTQQPYYQQYLNASSQATPPSPNTLGTSYGTESPSYSPASASGKASGHPVQSKGKELLHSAGIFGGKANVAAKGFFSKGKSKFRGSGGADKVDT